MKLPISLAVTVLLAACASPHAPMDHRIRATCNSNPCKVKVVVRGCGNIRTDPKFLDIPAGNRNNIEWEIHQDAGAGWVFTRNGIEFKSGGGGGFSSPGGGGSIRFVWHNNNANKGDHHYNVNVTRDGGRTICTEDPTIVNH